MALPKRRAAGLCSTVGVASGGYPEAMGDGVKARLGKLDLRRRGRRSADGDKPRPEPLDQGGSLDELVARFDIGTHRFVAGPRYGHDIDVADLPTLLRSVASHGEPRGSVAYVQLPGRCLALDEGSSDQRLADIEGRPRFRLLVATSHGSIIENIGVELWKRANRAYRSLSDDNAVRLSVPGAPPPERGPARVESGFDEPIDIVYTWVDSQDPAWREMASDYLDLEKLESDLYTPTDELRYSLRSVEVFAPWVHRVHILSNCAPPSWFKASDRVRWVDHAAVAPAGSLPAFNSGAIDTYLHRIPDLTEHFLYLNDDFMLWDSVLPSLFFERDGRSIARLASNSSVLYLQQLVDNDSAAPSQHSRVNAARLLEQRYGVFHTRVHGHVPYALRRSAMEELEREFDAEMEATRASRTRQPTDVSFIPYLYHHVGHSKGHVSYADAPPSFVTLQNYQRSGSRRALRSAPFVCLQDSRGSADDAAYQAFKRSTLEAALPLASASELAR